MISQIAKVRNQNIPTKQVIKSSDNSYEKGNLQSFKGIIDNRRYIDIIYSKRWDIFLILHFSGMKTGEEKKREENWRRHKEQQDKRTDRQMME